MVAFAITVRKLQGLICFFFFSFNNNEPGVGRLIGCFVIHTAAGSQLNLCPPVFPQTAVYGLAVVISVTGIFL